MSDLSQSVHSLRNKVHELQSRQDLQDQDRKRLEVTLDGIRSDVAVIRAAIVGDPTDPLKPGILVRLDRLEQTERTRSRLIWVVGTGVVALILERLRDLF